MTVVGARKNVNMRYPPLRVLKTHWVCCVLVLAGTLLGASSGFVRDRLWTSELCLDPKSAPAKDRETIRALVIAGYGSVEAAVAKRSHPDESYFELVRDELDRSADRSSWLRWRLIQELGTSAKLEDAGFLLRVSAKWPEKSLEDYALATARSIATNRNETQPRE